MAAGFQWDEDKGKLEWPDNIQSDQHKADFREHCKKRYAEENIEFLEELEKASNQDDFENLFTKYVANGAPSQININGNTSYSINGSKTNGTLSKSSFTSAANELAVLITNDLMTGFNPSAEPKVAPAVESNVAPESKGFSFGKLLSQVGGLLLSGLKEVGKFLFSSPSSKSTASQGANVGAFDLLTGGVDAVQAANPERHFDKRWGSSAVQAAENVTAARAALKENSSEENRQALKIAIDKLTEIVKKQTNEFLTDFEKAYPLKYQAYEAAKNLLNESVNPAPAQSVQNGSKPPVTPTFNAKKQADSDVRDQSQTRPSEPAIKPPTPRPK